MRRGQGYDPGPERQTEGGERGESTEHQQNLQKQFTFLGRGARIWMYTKLIKF